MNFILVGLGGFFGSVTRYGFYQIEKFFPHYHFPVVTILINVLGSLIAGILVSTLSKNFSLFFLVGFIGSFTTFSTFSLDNIALIQEGKWALAFFYTLISLVFGLASAWGGVMISVTYWPKH